MDCRLNQTLMMPPSTLTFGKASYASIQNPEEIQYGSINSKQSRKNINKISKRIGREVKNRLKQKNSSNSSRKSSKQVYCTNLVDLKKKHGPITQQSTPRNKPSTPMRLRYHKLLGINKTCRNPRSILKDAKERNMSQSSGLKQPSKVNWKGKEEANKNGVKRQSKSPIYKNRVTKPKPKNEVQNIPFWNFIKRYMESEAGSKEILKKARALLNKKDDESYNFDNIDDSTLSTATKDILKHVIELAEYL